MKVQTDRELLRLAAKAAGYRVRNLAGRYVYILDDDQPDDAMPLRQWNPLTDDGDALRLAVKLKLTVDILPWCVDARPWAEAGSADDGIRHDEYTDPYAATRRAIVRAAAALTQGA